MSETVKHPAKAAKCSPTQIDVFEAIAINRDQGHHPGTIQALLRKGLIRKGAHVMVNGWPIASPSYHVPVEIHHQWCCWCSENVKDTP